MSIRAIIKLRNFLRNNKTRNALRISSDVLALVKNRVQTTGRDSKGKRFSGYSEAVVPKSFYLGRSRSAGAERRLINHSSWFVSYKQFREMNNLRTDIVDLTFTGQMWKRTGVKIDKNTKHLTVVEISGRNEETQKKIAWNSERYGQSILSLSTSEKDMAHQAYRNYVSNSFRKFL